jgi:FAD-dependent urate hydroxylase
VAALRGRFGDWGAPVRKVLDVITDAETGFFPHYRHAVPASWGTGRITVIGDAAHSMPPTRAQGANQALEDAWAMARALRGAGDVPGALRSFERARSPKASLVARHSGSEDYNRYGRLLSRLIPSALASRYYIRWLSQVSSYLASDQLAPPPGSLAP